MSVPLNSVDNRSNHPIEESTTYRTRSNDNTSESLGDTPCQTEEDKTIVQHVVDSFWTGLSQTEKNALDVSSAVNQFVILSNRDQYNKAVEIILNDPSLSTEEKLRLKAEEDERQDLKDARTTQRITCLQASQKCSVIDIIMTYGFGIGGSISILLLLGTKTGRSFLGKVGTWALREAPTLIHQTAS